MGISLDWFGIHSYLTIEVLTGKEDFAMMSELYKGSTYNGANDESKEGERGPLYSNKAIVRSPSLDFQDDSFSEENQNLIGVFSILLEVDKRLRPQNYQPRQIKHESDNSS